MSENAKQATPHAQLIIELLDSRVPKTERGHAAAREIEALRAEIDRLRAENEALRRDAERWKWVERHAGASSTGGVWSFRFQTADGMFSLAEAIDEAMKQEGER